MEEQIKNESGNIVLPTSQLNPVDPVAGVDYVEDSVYESLKSGQANGTDQPDGNPPAEIIPGADQGGLADTPAPNPIDYDAILKEKTGGKYEKWEDLLSKVESKVELNATSKKIYDAILAGKEEEVAQVLYQRQLFSNVDKLADTDVIKMKMQLDNPDWSPEDVEDEYNDRYGMRESADDYSDTEWAKLERRHARKLSSEAKQAREAMSALKDQIELPDFGTSSVDPEAEKFLQDFEKFSGEYAAGLKNTLDSFKKLDLSITDEDVQFRHEYSVNDEDKADLANKAKDYWSYIQGRYTKDGKFDTQKLAEDIYFNENRSKIIKSAVTRAMHLAKAETVKGVANVQDSRVPAPATDQAAEQARAEFMRFLLS